VGEEGVWVGTSVEAASPLPQMGQWPPANVGTSAAGGQTQSFWLSSGSEGWPMTKGLTSGLLGRGNGLKVCSPRAFNIAPVEGGWVKAGHPCKLVVFPPQGQEARGPP